MQKEYSILDAHLLSNNYIVLLSGLDCSPISTVTKELCIAFNGTVLDYMHLPFNSDLKVVNDRVHDLLKQKKQILFIKAKSFDKKYIKIPVDIHINISISDKQINDLSISTQYKEVIKENYIHKYFNFKHDANIDEYIDNIFTYIIDDIEKKLYKDKYQTLSHKFYVEGQGSIDKPESAYNSTLMYDKNSLTADDWNNKAITMADNELKEDLDDSATDEDLDDMLNESVRIR